MGWRPHLRSREGRVRSSPRPPAALEAFHTGALATHLRHDEGDEQKRDEKHDACERDRDEDVWVHLGVRTDRESTDVPARRCDGRRDDQHRTARDADEVCGDAPEPGGLEAPAAARADDDQLRSLIVGKVRKAVRGESEHHASLGVADLLLVDDPIDEASPGGGQGIERERRELADRRAEAPCRRLRLHDVRDNEARLEPTSEPGGDAQRGAGARRAVDATQNRVDHGVSFRRVHALSVAARPRRHHPSATPICEGRSRMRGRACVGPRNGRDGVSAGATRLGVGATFASCAH